MARRGAGRIWAARRPRWPRALSSFLARFGHRGISEGELPRGPGRTTPPPSSRPSPPSRAVTGIARAAAAERRRGGRGGAPVRGRAVGRRTPAAAPSPRPRTACGGASSTKSLAVRFIAARAPAWPGRRARHWPRTGASTRGDDVFFLTLAELRAAGGGTTVPARRRSRAGGAGVTRARARPRPARGRSRRGAAARAPSSHGALAGIAVSAGIGVGPARVLRSGEPPAIAAGEVLVAPVLDAAYGPLLASAAGAVAEMGGLLSHGAVVARELGVPCVVDVRDATRRIRPGQTVRVDGGTGLVGDPRFAAPPPPRAQSGRSPLPIPADESFHPLEDHPARARERVLQRAGPRGGAGAGRLGRRAAAAGAGRRSWPCRCGRASALRGRPRGRARPASRAGGERSRGRVLARSGSRSDGRLAAHRGPFPPGPVPLLLTPREVAVRLDLRFSPTTPAIDFCDGLPDDVREALRPLGAHHVEQSGAWTGTVDVDGRVSDASPARAAATTRGAGATGRPPTGGGCSRCASATTSPSTPSS